MVADSKNSGQDGKKMEKLDIGGGEIIGVPLKKTKPPFKSSVTMPIDEEAPAFLDNSKGHPLEVSVENSLEKAIKVLKRKLIKEGIFKELKARRYHEKDCEKRKRKVKESIKKIRKDEARAKKNASLL